MPIGRYKRKGNDSNTDGECCCEGSEVDAGGTRMERGTHILVELVITESITRLYL